MDWEITEDLSIHVRYEFVTDTGTAWSIPLRPAAVEANCDQHKRAAFELARYEKLAERLIRQGLPKEQVRDLLADLVGEVVGELLDELHGVAI